MVAHDAIDEGDVVIREAKVSSEAASGDGGIRPRDLATNEGETVGRIRRSGLGDLSSDGQRSDFAICYKARTAAPYKIGVALDQAVADIYKIANVIHQDGVLEAGKPHVEENDALAIRAQSFSLAAAFGRAV